jgi:hypothetical protein
VRGRSIGSSGLTNPEAELCSSAAVWATDSFHGLPAGTVYRNGDEVGDGRPQRPACGARGPFFYFAGRSLEDVPASWRCPDWKLVGHR